MINTYNMKEVKAILGVTSSNQIKSLIDNDGLPSLAIGKNTYDFPKIGLADWLVEEGLFRNADEAEEHMTKAIRTMRAKETKRKNKKKES
jgi:hypothetical protein